MNQRAVVDASVALKWRLDDEEHVEEAVALRDDFVLRGAVELLAPTLLVYEMANGLVMAARRGRLGQEEVVDSMRATLRLGVRLKDADAVRVCQLARAYGITAYDAAYIALGEGEGCALWTGDHELYIAVRRDLPWIHWIGDYVGSGP